MTAGCNRTLGSLPRLMRVRTFGNTARPVHLNIRERKDLEALLMIGQVPRQYAQRLPPVLVRARGALVASVQDVQPAKWQQRDKIWHKAGGFP